MNDSIKQAISILEANGYTIGAVGEDALGQYVVVNDPVQCSSGGGRKWTEHRHVTIRGSSEAAKFCVDRS